MLSVLALFAAGASGLGGCAGGDGLKGRVITGSAGIVTVAPDDGAHDNRDGVEGVTVSLRAMTAGAQGRVLGEGVSDKTGRFQIATARQDARGQIEVTAEAPGWQRQRGTVTFPGAGQLLLIIMPTPEAPDAGDAGAAPTDTPGE